MSQLREVFAEILTDGQDLEIDENDMVLIRQHLPASGAIPEADLAVLAEMRRQARVVCPAFDQLFFPAFKTHLLADGKITSAEQFALLRLLYGGGGVDATKKLFLEDLRRSLSEPNAEFEDLYRQVMTE